MLLLSLTFLEVVVAYILGFPGVRGWKPTKVFLTLQASLEQSPYHTTSSSVFIKSPCPQMSRSNGFDSQMTSAQTVTAVGPCINFKSCPDPVLVTLVILPLPPSIPPPSNAQQEPLAAVPSVIM